MFRKFSVFCFLLLLVQSIYAQSVESKKDSIGTRKISTKIIFNIDTRASLVHNLPVQIGGMKIGIQLGQHHRLGIGFYLMGLPIFGQMIFKPASYDVNSISHKNVVVKNKPTQVNTIESDQSIMLSMAYASVFYEYVLLTRKRWELSIPIQLALGQATYTSSVLSTTTNPATNINKSITYNRPTEYKLIFLGETSLNLQFKVFCWMGIGGGLGYRRLFNDNNNPKTANTFDNIIWVAKLKIFPVDLLKVLKSKQKWHKVY